MTAGAASGGLRRWVWPEPPRRFRGTVLAWLLLAAAAWQATPARADDTFVAVGVGGLVFQQTSQVAMQREDLFLSPSEVRVHYEMRNASRSPVSGRVAFPLPPIPADERPRFGMTMIPDQPEPGFLRFALRVNGQVQPTAARVWATRNGMDVTATLAANGVDVRALSLRPHLDPAALGEAAIARLLAAGLLARDGVDLFARWDSNVAFEWDQLFPPGVTVIEHGYVPLLGGLYDTGNTTWSALDENAAPYCIQQAVRAAALASLRKRQRADPSAMVWMTFLSFVLRTARNWQGPIGTLSVTLRAGHPDDAVALCSPHLAFRRSGPGELSARAVRWTARDDIRAAFISSRPPPPP